MMEGIKGLGAAVGGGRVAIGVGNGGDQVIQDQDMGDGMQCSDHPYRNNPGGICAFCLQEKLGKLVSSSFPLPIRGSASSSSSPSFRSDLSGPTNAAGGVSVPGPSSTSLSLSLSVRPKPNGESFHHDEYYTRRARISFLLAKKKKKVTANAASSDGHNRAADIVFKRSKSTTTPRRAHFMDAADDFSPRKRNGFWSFLYHHHHHHSSKKIDNKSFRDNSKISSSSFASTTTATAAAATAPKSLGSSSLRNKGEHAVAEAEDDSSPNSQATASASSFERKVSRSRSVGCGSRSFSGDFFERISTGFGDCTLRRVESQREGKPKHSSSSSAVRNGAERVKCGGLFSGFMMTSSSSSSSSSSYWVSSSAEDMNGKPMSGAAGQLVNGRSRSSWGWAFASPMRAFSKPSSKDGKRDITRQANNSDKNTTPNLSAIPSLLSVRG
ncbi:hypothetical protein M0R45_020981 [Rubus argutus]|uniref:Uncharacterized protein n=1 Tax=Rubus argutus TaxID=59490 RepID=A0AAW1XCA7_RUBAR